MFPAIIMISTLTKFVHHGSSCCRGLDHYYCIPKPYGESEDLNDNPYLNPSHLWDPAFAEQHQILGQHPSQPIRRGGSKEGTNLEEDAPHLVSKEEPMNHADDVVDRIDHYTQLVPENFVNTENEISYLTGNEAEREENNVNTNSEPSSSDGVYQKYNMK